jgi:hypothetical protein
LKNGLKNKLTTLPDISKNANLVRLRFESGLVE